MTKRRGISLVELMLTLSACCVILTLSAGLIHRALHAQSKARRFFDGERSAVRLSQSFRRDVHQAQSVAVGDEIREEIREEIRDEAGSKSESGDALLRVELPGGQTALYRQSAGRVERTWHVDGKVRAREAFVFPPETRLTAAKQSPKLVTLSIDAPAIPAEQPGAPLPAYAFPVSLQVQAILGRNAALVEIAGAPENTAAEKSP